MKIKSKEAQTLKNKCKLIIDFSKKAWTASNRELPQIFQSYQSIQDTQIDDYLKEGKLIKSDNKIYLGMVHEGNRQGKGITIYKDGTVHEGLYKNNLKFGQGWQLSSDYKLYFGEYLQGRKSGKGKMYWLQQHQSNDKLQQNRQNNNNINQNNLIWIQEYQGNWWGGLPDGLGHHRTALGDIYVGQFRNGLRHGQGEQHYYNDDKYVGKFVNGLPQGFGQYTWNDGSSYKGDFKQGWRSGYGVWTHDKMKYSGHYILDLKHGYGILQWGNGYQYRGNFKNDKRQGFGELILKGQVLYKGNWINGQQQEQKQSSRSQSYQRTLSRNKNKSPQKQKTVIPYKLKNEQNSFELKVNCHEKAKFESRCCPACQIKKSKSKNKIKVCRYC